MPVVPVRRPPTRALVAAILVVLIALGIVFARHAGAQAPAVQARHGQPLGESYSYTFHIVTSDGDPISGRTHVLGDRARIEITGEKGGRARSDWLLVQPNGRLAVVKPEERTYSEIEADAFERIVGKAMEAVDRAMTFQVRDLDVVGQRLAEGGMVAGHRTERSRVSQTFDLRVGVLGFNSTNRHRIDTEYWTAPGLELPRNPLIELFVSMPSVMALADRGFVNRTAVARKALVGKGTPLRALVTSRTYDETGDETERDELSVEILSITPARHDAARFAVPEGYRKTEGFSWNVESGRTHRR